MRIDFKQLGKLEKQYVENDQQLAMSTLSMMIDQVLNNVFVDSTGIQHVNSNPIAIATLKNLKILVDDKEENEVKQLNS